MTTAPIPSSQAFTIVASGYYRSPDPQQAALALSHMLAMLAAAKDEDLGRFGSLLYLLRRIAQVSADAHVLFLRVLEGFKGPHRELLTAITGAREAGQSPNALDMPIEGPQSLDLLWAEFFVTGAPEPVLRIIQALDGEDRVRRRLERWLQGGSFFNRWKRRAVADTLREVGLDIDLDAKAIVTRADLDCLCFSIAERRFPIFQHLPFALGPEEINALGIKGSALWSLRLNAAEHPAVAALCRTEQSRPGGAARARLAEAVEGKPFAL